MKNSRLIHMQNCGETKVFFSRDSKSITTYKTNRLTFNSKWTTMHASHVSHLCNISLLSYVGSSPDVVKNLFTIYNKSILTSHQMTKVYTLQSKQTSYLTYYSTSNWAWPWKNFWKGMQSCEKLEPVNDFHTSLAWILFFLMLTNTNITRFYLSKYNRVIIVFVPCSLTVNVLDFESVDIVLIPAKPRFLLNFTCMRTMSWLRIVNHWTIERSTNICVIIIHE